VNRSVVKKTEKKLVQSVDGAGRKIAKTVALSDCRGRRVI